MPVKAAIKRTITAVWWAIRGLQRYLGRVSSLVYLFAYVLLIFAFAGAFYGLPARSFYHSTSQYEYGIFTRDADTILSALGAHISDSMVRRYGTDHPNINGWIVDSQAMKVDSIYVKKFPEDVVFQLSAPLSWNDPVTDGNAVTTEKWAVTVPLQQLTVMDDLLYFYITPVEPPVPLFEGIPTFPSLEQMLPGFSEFDGALTPVLSLPISLYNDIIRFGEGYRGFPSGVSGHFQRMLYFSAGVATSSALGDISPITSTARALVTLEALLSVILVGLFLNAIAVYIGDRGRLA